MLHQMRILHVIPAFAPALRWGGPINAAVELTQEQARQGHEVTVFTTNNDVDGRVDVPLGQPVTMNGVKVYYWAVTRPTPMTFSIPLSCALRDSVSHFDLLHIHMIFNWPTTIAAYWARRKKIPYIIRPAGSLDPVALTKSYDSRVRSLKSRAKKWLYFRTVGRAELDNAAALHFTTKTERDTAQVLGIRAPGIVVPLGVPSMPAADGSSRDRLLDKYPELRGKKILLFLARLDPIKGLDILLLALGQLARRREDFALIVAGDGSQEYRNEMVTLAQNSGIGGKTLFLGPVFGTTKWQILTGAEIFVLSSHHENFGLAVAEALTVGLPVVISRHVNLAGDIRAAGAGIVVGCSPSEVRVAVETLLDSAQLRNEMGSRGRLLAARRFAWPSIVRSLNDAYVEAVNRAT
jgi:glycosyltransferase involved in cell wall biosynthesis